MFQGFSERTIQFLWEIRLNNQRPWFQEHKQTYLEDLYDPMKEMGAEVQERTLAQYPKSQLNLKVARIYRDARRLHSGGPYKDHLWFTLHPAVEQWRSAPAFYFEVNPEGYEYGLGYSCPKASLMEAYRQHILAAPERMERLIRKWNRQSQFLLEGPEYKRPKGQVSKLLQPWFNRKSVTLCAFHRMDEVFCSPALVDRVVDGFSWLMPYYQYLMEICPLEL